MNTPKCVTLNGTKFTIIIVCGVNTFLLVRAVKLTQRVTHNGTKCSIIIVVGVKSVRLVIAVKLTQSVSHSMEQRLL
jgi:hypothetical protein